MSTAAIEAQVQVGTASAVGATSATVVIPRVFQSFSLESWITSDGANNKYFEILERDLPLLSGQLLHGWDRITGAGQPSSFVGILESGTFVRGVRSTGIYAGKAFLQFEMTQYWAAADNTDNAGVVRTVERLGQQIVVDWVAAWALGLTATLLEVTSVGGSGSAMPMASDFNAAANLQLVANETYLGGYPSSGGLGTPSFRSENVPNFSGGMTITAATDAAADIELRVGYHYERVI